MNWLFVLTKYLVPVAVAIVTLTLRKKYNDVFLPLPNKCVLRFLKIISPIYHFVLHFENLFLLIM